MVVGLPVGRGSGEKNRVLAQEFKSNPKMAED
jgi:hypothetical protein